MVRLESLASAIWRSALVALHYGIRSAFLQFMFLTEVMYVVCGSTHVGDTQARPSFLIESPLIALLDIFFIIIMGK